MSDKRTFEQLMNDLQKELVTLTWELKGSKDEEDYVIGRIVLAIGALKQLHGKRT
jgi:hypothetical protein